MAESLIYVYAVGDAELAIAIPPGTTGVTGSPVHGLVAGRLAAAVSPVDPFHFSEESLQRNLEDLSWLAATARAHHAVVDALGRRHPIAPLRLATVYVDDDNVRALLVAREAAFARALDRIRGRTEWGVKAFAVAPPEPGPEESAETDLGPGAAYLMRKRAERDRAFRGRRQAHDAAEELHRSLAEMAVDSRRYAPQDPRLTGHRDEMVLNAAYLVEDAASTAFCSDVEAVRSPHLRTMLTGPWAPYSFATLEEP